MAFVPHTKRTREGQRPAPAAEPRRDSYDRLQLWSAIASTTGTVIAAVTACGALWISIESGNENSAATRKALARIADLAEAQAKQAAEAQKQTASFQAQARSLSISAEVAASEMLASERKALEDDQPALAVSIRQEISTGTSSLVLEVSNTGGRAIHIHRISSEDKIVEFGGARSAEGPPSGVDVTSAFYEAFLITQRTGYGLLIYPTSMCLKVVGVDAQPGRVVTEKCNLPSETEMDRFSPPPAWLGMEVQLKILVSTSSGRFWSTKLTFSQLLGGRSKPFEPSAPTRWTLETNPDAIAPAKRER